MAALCSALPETQEHLQLRKNRKEEEEEEEEEEDALNDWATGDVGMHEHHTLVSNSFAGTHCML